MALQGSPKRLAEDISNGYFFVTLPYLKTLSTTEIKELYHALKIVQRDIRAIVTTDTEDTKKKQMRLMRLNNVFTVIENYARKHRIML